MASARELGMVFREEVAVFTGTNGRKDLDEPAQNTESVPPGRAAKDSREDNRYSFEENEGKDDGEILQVVIPPGFTLDSISVLLLEEEVINDRVIFKELADELKAARKIQAGVYNLPRHGDSYEVMKILLKGGERID